MKTKIIPVVIPDDCNIIFGMSHFIKTVEDLYETMVSTVPSVEFGIAFCEASGDCLIRSDGNDDKLIKMAEQAAFDVACGHSFFIFMRNAFPINFLPRIKSIPEVCRIFCATANPLEVIIGETGQGRGVMGVIDGKMPVGIEKQKDKKARHKFLRDIGYKR